MLRLAARAAGRVSLLQFSFAPFGLRKPNKPRHSPEQLAALRTNSKFYAKAKNIRQLSQKLQAMKEFDKTDEKQDEPGKQSQKNKKEASQLKIQLPEGESNKMLWLIAIAAAGIYFLHNHVDDAVSLGIETNEADFYNRLSTGQFTNLKVVRRLEKSTKGNEKEEWVTRLVGVSGTSNYVVLVPNLTQTLQKLNDLNIRVEFEHHANKSATKKKSNIGYALEVLFIGAILFVMARMKKSGFGGINDLTKNIRGKPFKPTALTIKTQFKDVAGLQEAKHEIMEFVQFLKKPDKFTEMGAKIPRGALLTGPPGTGKTLLAKACAGEAGVPFFYISGSEFVEKFVGVGASRVRSLFESANKKAPSIIFIDEVDAIGKKRGSGPRTNEERVSTLNQLLVNMDGFGTDSKVVVLAATNRKDMLDPALLRPGRFDRIIEVSLPDLQGRYEILCVHLEKIRFDPSLTKDNLAKRLSSLTPGFSGADLSNICNEAAILAARANKEYVDMIDFEKATERVLAGLEKRNNLTGEEKRIIAYHESGRAVASWLLEGGDPLIKLTIIPRSKKALGFSQFLPDQVSLYTKQQLLDKISCALAGKVSEELVLGQITDSSTADLEKARKIANAMVTRYGMSDVVSNIGYPQNELIKKPYSPSLQEKIDDAVFGIISKETERVKQLLQKNMDKLNALAEAVLRKQTLNLDELKTILGQRPFAAKSNFKAYLDLKDQQPPSEPVS